MPCIKEPKVLLVVCHHDNELQDVSNQTNGISLIPPTYRYVKGILKP
jgi:hypothetical protein